VRSPLNGSIVRQTDSTMGAVAVKPEKWELVDDQVGLDAIDASVNWDDAEAVAFVADTLASNQMSPSDVARSGYTNWNIRVLLYVAHKRGSHLELVLVDCDEIGAHVFRGLTLRGRVDALKRVEVHDSDGQRRLRCSRLMYRFIDVDQTLARQFYGFDRAIPEGAAG
jgi:hypothetical protein